jgi:hypothetical protein
VVAVLQVERLVTAPVEQTLQLQEYSPLLEVVLVTRQVVLVVVETLSVVAQEEQV